VSAQLARLGEAIDAAVASGKLTAAVRDRFAALATRLHAETSAEFERVLLAARETLRPLTTGRAARETASLLDDLVALRGEIAGRASARGSGLEPVLRSLDALIERIDAGRIQNVRGFEVAYQFLEIPVRRESGIDRVQVHFFEDGRSAADDETKSHTVVLDLELSQLGAIWIHLQTIGEACTCVIRATSDSAVHALDEAAPSLSESLQSAGYGRVQVRAEAWEGDRVSALANMASRFAGFDAHA
jgi:hypothetical protein